MASTRAATRCGTVDDVERPIHPYDAFGAQNESVRAYRLPIARAHTHALSATGRVTQRVHNVVAMGDAIDRASSAVRRIGATLSLSFPADTDRARDVLAALYGAVVLARTHDDDDDDVVAAHDRWADDGGAIGLVDY